MNSEGCARQVTILLATTLALVSIMFPTPGHAANRLALVIGNAAYKEAPLRNAVNDARAMAATLQGLGFEVIRLENANKEQIERAVVQFTSRLSDDSSGLFYYAGHGIQIRGRNYLVPVGTRFQSQQEARIESVGVDLVLNELAYAGNQLNIVVLDACRNNPFERRLRGASRGLAAIDAARGTLIAYATSPGSVALDGEGRNGLFTEELLRALGKPGLKIEEVFKNARVEVARRTNNQQIPWESSSLTGDFVFNPIAMNTSPAVQTGRKQETMFWEITDHIGTAGAYRAYLDRYPEGVFARVATLRIDELDRGAASIGEQIAKVDDLSQTQSPPPSATQFRETALISVLTPVGNHYSCIHTNFSSGDTLYALRSRVEKAGMSTNASRNYGWNVDLDVEELWRQVGLRKLPIPEFVFQHGEVLDVDGMLLSWFNVSGKSTCRVDFRIYLFDVRLKKFYKDEATEANLNSVTDNLVEQFLKERALAQRRTQ
jgi:hypothetical protein